MDELLDLMIADESPSQVSDAIKDMLFAKAAEKVDAYRPTAALKSFGFPESESESEVDYDQDEEEES